MRSRSTRRWNGCNTFPSKTWGLPRWTITGPCGKGFPEVILGEGKEVSDIAEIARAIRKRGDNVLITRLSQEKMDSLKTRLRGFRFHRQARAATWRAKDATIKGKGTIAVVCAGTSDIPVAEEAAVTSEIMGNRVERLYDVGVAGLHRLLGHHRQLTEAALLIVVAGMEGRLAQRRGRGWSGGRSSPCPPASATAPASRVCRHCWRC